MGSLSNRMRDLLVLVDDCTQWEGDERPGRKLTRFFMPPGGSKEGWSETLGRYVYVSGSSDAAALKALARRGLIKAERFPYSYSITEEGILELSRVQS